MSPGLDHLREVVWSKEGARHHGYAGARWLSPAAGHLLPAQDKVLMSRCA